MPAITLTASCLPIFTTMLGNLKHFLAVAIQDAAARGYDGKVLVAARLAPDMLPLKNQITMACDAAKLCLARVGGVDAPKFDDNEQTLEDLQARIDATLAWLRSLPATVLDGLEDKAVTFPVGRDGSTRTMTGADYVRHWALPNCLFHVTTAYALLRHNGVKLGKRDFLAGASA